MSAEPETKPAEASPDSATKKRKSNLADIEVDVSAPEPPSKKARRALKKGKPLPSKPSSDDERRRKRKKNKEDTTKDDNISDDDKEGGKKEGGKKARSEYSVWIGNLPFTVTGEKLVEWLVENSGGAILAENVTRVKLPKSKDKAPPSRGGDGKTERPANRGFAYVDFDGLGPQVAAIALSENDLGGRKLLTKDAKSFEGRPKKERDEPAAANGAGDEADKNANRKVFVGNLSYAVTEDDLWTHFQKCGEIDWVKVATFEDTGKCKGYGWVRFREPTGAAWAVKGFVKIKEEVETEEDFAEKGDEDGKEAPTEPRKMQTRKWWVNKLQGRALKIELAEEDQVRYKKRFGKDAQKQKKPVDNGEEATTSIVADATKAAMAAEAAAA